MKIRVYQINVDRDVNNVKFQPYDFLNKFQGRNEVDSKIYDKIYDKEVDCKNLEDIFIMLNVSIPDDYKGHSLSLSDVVEIYESDYLEKGFYYCDSVGYQKIEFDSSKCQVSERINKEPDKISVLLVEPNKSPKMIEIEDSLEEMQKLVGGDIEEYMPFGESVAIVCNQESKFNGDYPNRAIYTPDNKLMDVVFGKFFVCYAPVASEKFLSLPSELAKKYEEKFKYPERFFKNGNDIVVVPIKPKLKEQDR